MFFYVSVKGLYGWDVNEIVNEIVLMIQCVFCLLWLFWFLGSCWVVKCNQEGYNDYPFYLTQKEISKDYMISQEKELEKLREFQEFEGR
jgi:hypothetical protein